MGGAKTMVCCLCKKPEAEYKTIDSDGTHRAAHSSCLDAGVFRDCTFCGQASVSESMTICARAGADGVTWCWWSHYGCLEKNKKVPFTPAQAQVQHLEVELAANKRRREDISREASRASEEQSRLEKELHAARAKASKEQWTAEARTWLETFARALAQGVGQVTDGKVSPPTFQPHDAGKQSSEFQLDLLSGERMLVKVTHQANTRAKDAASSVPVVNHIYSDRKTTPT